MRTTVTINDTLYADAKVHAARSGRGVGSVIEDALRDYLERATSARPSDVTPLPAMRSGGVRPGIDLKASLVERAISLSQSKYCSATKMLGATAEITHAYELLEINS